MEVVHERCCGLDVHKKTVVACVLTPQGRTTRSFDTTTAGLLILADWLQAEGVTHVAMESTGVYWKPPYNLLEGLGMTLLVVNAGHIKAVPGRKTDVKDAEWIADLLRHGLLRGSFIPDRGQRELRELVRYRKSLTQQRSQVTLRIQKLLEGANIKLRDVASNVLGVSGRAMLEAIVAGNQDSLSLAAMARGKLRKKQPQLEQALTGLIGPHQRVLLASQLRSVDHLDQEIARLDEEVANRMAPFQAAIDLIDAIPGIGRRLAEQILAETGVDMSRFPSSHHLASWARMCPGNNESAGKRFSGATGVGNPWLRGALVEAAWAASRTHNTYLSTQYHRLAARRGKKRAIVAVGHTILITIYHLLGDGTVYQDLGTSHFDNIARERVTKGAVNRLERLGYKVTLEPAA